MSSAQFVAVKKELGLAEENGKGKGRGKRERAPTQLAAHQLHLPLKILSSLDLLCLNKVRETARQSTRSARSPCAVLSTMAGAAASGARSLGSTGAMSSGHRVRFAARSSIPVLPTTRNATVHWHSGIDLLLLLLLHVKDVSLSQQNSS